MSPLDKFAMFGLCWLAVSTAAVFLLCRIMGANRDDDREEESSHA